METVFPITEKGRYGPLKAGHPCVGQPCVSCGSPLEAGQAPSLVNGIPANDEDWMKAANGRAHTVMTELAHESCAYPQE